jgi:hypothetical protein
MASPLIFMDRRIEGNNRARIKKALSASQLPGCSISGCNEDDKKADSWPIKLRANN